MSKRKPEISDRTTLIFDRNIDTVSKTLYLHRSPRTPEDEDDVDAFLTMDIIKAIDILDDTLPELPLTVKLHNSGGCINDGLAIYSALRLCKSRVRIEVVGVAESAGSIILQAGDERVMHTYSRLMVHIGTMGVGSGTIVHNARREIAESNKLDQFMFDIYLNNIRKVHPSYSLKQLNKLLEWDTYLSAQEALELGFITEIIEIPH